MSLYLFSQNMVNGSGSCFFPGDSYPNWLTFYSECSSATFDVPQAEGRNLKTIMFIAYISTPYNITSEGVKGMLVINHAKSIIQLYRREALVSFEDEEGQRLASSMEVIFVFIHDYFTVKKTAVYLLYDAQDLNLISSRSDESECSEDEPTDDFNQNNVLDDVSTLDQLNALCESPQLFESGGRIIITSGDMNILEENGVDEVLEI